MKQVVNFETESEAQSYCDEACTASKEDHKARDYNPKWDATTTKWGDPKERLDGTWDSPMCSAMDHTGLTVEDYDAANYPSEEA